jgi:hypothetical protein
MTSAGKKLQVGQTVRLDEQAGGYHIAVLPPGGPGYAVVEVGREHVVFEDTVAGMRTQRPLYLIASVVPAAEATA